MILTLPSEIERALQHEARAKGTTPEKLAAQHLRAATGAAPSATTESESEKSLSDFLGERIGALRSSEHTSGGARLSERTGEAFARSMARKHRGDHDS